MVTFRLKQKSDIQNPFLEELRCAPPFVKYYDGCYWLSDSTNRKNWHAANDYCVNKLNSTLVEIYSGGENRFLRGKDYTAVFFHLCNSKPLYKEMLILFFIDLVKENTWIGLRRLPTAGIPDYYVQYSSGKNVSRYEYLERNCCVASNHLFSTM